MFCYQCEQTAQGKGCTKVGVCGKQPEVAALQDLLIYAVTGLSVVAAAARTAGIHDSAVNRVTCEAMFATLTNVDCDPERFKPLIERCVHLKDTLKKKLETAGGPAAFPDGPARYVPAESLEDLIRQGEEVGLKPTATIDPDIVSLSS